MINTAATMDSINSASSNCEIHILFKKIYIYVYSICQPTEPQIKSQYILKAWYNADYKDFQHSTFTLINQNN